jgi:hypothetical protein
MVPWKVTYDSLDCIMNFSHSWDGFNQFYSYFKEACLQIHVNLHENFENVLKV